MPAYPILGITFMDRLMADLDKDIVLMGKRNK